MKLEKQLAEISSTALTSQESEHQPMPHDSDVCFVKGSHGTRVWEN